LAKIEMQKQQTSCETNKRVAQTISAECNGNVPNNQKGA